MQPGSSCSPLMHLARAGPSSTSAAIPPSRLGRHLDVQMSISASRLGRHLDVQMSIPPSRLGRHLDAELTLTCACMHLRVAWGRRKWRSHRQRGLGPGSALAPRHADARARAMSRGQQGARAPRRRSNATRLGGSRGSRGVRHALISAVAEAHAGGYDGGYERLTEAIWLFRIWHSTGQLARAGAPVGRAQTTHTQRGDGTSL